MSDQGRFQSVLGSIMNSFGNDNEGLEGTLEIMDKIVKSHLTKIATDAIQAAHTRNTGVSGLDVIFLLVKDQTKVKRYKDFIKIKGYYAKSEDSRFKTTDMQVTADGEEGIEDLQFSELATQKIATTIFQKPSQFREYITNVIPTSVPASQRRSTRTRGQSAMKDYTSRRVAGSALLPLEEGIVFDFLFFSVVDVIGLVMRNAFCIAREMEEQERMNVQAYPGRASLMNSLVFPPNPSEQYSSCLLLEVESYYERAPYEVPNYRTGGVSTFDRKSCEYSVEKFFRGMYEKNAATIKPDHIREAVRRLQPQNHGAIDMLGCGTSGHKRKRSII